MEQNLWVENAYKINYVDFNNFNNGGLKAAKFVGKKMF
jgi:hypothetical protein